MAMKLEADEVAMVVSALRTEANYRRYGSGLAERERREGDAQQLRKEAESIERIAARMEGQTVSVG